MLTEITGLYKKEMSFCGVTVTAQEFVEGQTRPGFFGKSHLHEPAALGATLDGKRMIHSGKKGNLPTLQHRELMCMLFDPGPPVLFIGE